MNFQQEVNKIGNVYSLSSYLEGSPLLVAFQKLEVTMRDKEKVYLVKVESLLSVLENVITNLPWLSALQISVLFQFLYKHILSIILHGDWLKDKSAVLHMITMLKRFEINVNRRNIPIVILSFRHILDVLYDPWGFTIKKILFEEKCTDKELLDLVMSELDHVLKFRLEIMLLAHCDCQALQLIESCLQCIENPVNCQLFLKFADEITVLKDIYLLLLVKANNNVKLTKEVLKLDLVECLKLISRCTEVGYLSSLKRSLLKMVDIVTNMVLASSMIQPVCDEVNLEKLIKEWCNLYTNTHVLFHLVKIMSLHAITSHHIYLLLKVLVKKYGTVEKSLCIELYIRAFTMNLNEIEVNKLNCKHEKVKQSEVELSIGFLSLADYIKEDIITSRECVLTSYSLNPTSNCYEEIKQLAITSGSFKLNFQNIRSPENNSENCTSFSNGQAYEFVNEDEIDLHSGRETVSPLKTDYETLNIDLANNIKTTPHLMPDDTIISPATIHISDANKLGIPQTLCDDLSTVISSGRYKLLNWNLHWPELSSRCKIYRTCGKYIRGSNKELNYLKIDFNQFKILQENTELNKICTEEGFEKHFQ